MWRLYYLLVPKVQDNFSRLSKVGFFLFISFLTNSLFSQKFNFTHFDTEDGLPSSEVYQSYQDKEGFMWFATDRGLVKYDGNKFKTYTKEDGLCSNVIFGFYVDYKDRIWLFGFTNCLSYIEDGKINKLPLLETKETRYRPVSSLHVDSLDNIFVGIKGSDCTYKVSLSDKNVFATINSNAAYILREYNNQQFITSCGGEFSKNLKIHWSNNNFSTYKIVGGEDRLSIGISYLYSKVSNELLYSVYNQLMKINYEDKQIVSTIELPENSTMSLFQDRENNIWIGLEDSGAICFDIDHLEIRRRVLVGKTVSSILQDDEGGYWFTTLNSGVYYFPSFAIRTGNDPNLPFLNFNSLSVIDSSLFIGSKQGYIYRLNEGKSLILNRFYDKKERLYEISNSLPGVISIYLEKNDRPIKDTVIEGYTIREYGGIAGSFFPKKNITYQVNSGSLHWWKDSTLNYEPWFIGGVRGVSTFQDKLLMYGYNGIWCLDDSLPKSISKENGVEDQEIADISFKDSLLFIATRDQGIVVSDQKNKKQWSIKTPQGLTNLSIDKLVFTNTNTLWAGTKVGLFKIVFDPTFSSATSFLIDRNMGLLSNGIKDIELFNNMIYVITKDGISGFDQNLKVTKTNFQVYLSSIIINDTLILNNKSRDRFDHSFSSFEFNFTSPSYRYKGALSYQYFLEGFDERWHSTKDNTVRYMLTSGTYNFKVRALHNNQPIHTSIVNYPFSIRFPFYEQWWFILIVSCFVFLVLAALLFWRFKLIKQKSQLELQMVKSQHQALTAQLKPHFIFNAINSIHSHILRNKSSESANYLVKFSQLLRKVLNHSNHTFISLEKELDIVQQYLEIEKLRFKDKLSYFIDIDSSLDTKQIQIPTQIIQPYVENAIWHGIMPKEGNGKVKLKIVKQDKFICISISDNGVGRKVYENVDKTHKSMGMNINKERLDLVNTILKESITLKIVDKVNVNGTAEGTKIILNIPLIINKKVKRQC